MRISRRAALAGATAAVAVAAIPAAQAATDETLLRMEQEWLAFRDYANNYPDESDEARGPLYARLQEMEDRIFATPAQTPGGIAVKLRLWSHYYVPFTDRKFWWRGDVDQMNGHEFGLGMTMRDLERLAGAV